MVIGVGNAGAKEAVAMPLSTAKQQFSQVVNLVASGKERVVVEKSGLPVVAIISLDEFRRFERAERERNARFDALQRVSEAFADVPVEELEAEIDAVLQRVRTGRSAQQ